MIDMCRRDPHDDKTPEEVIARIVDSWGMSPDRRPLPELIIEALVYKAYFEQAEGALRWLDTSGVLDRISGSTQMTDAHHPVGAYLPIGQLDGDCSCGKGAWPCAPLAVDPDGPRPDN